MTYGDLDTLDILNIIKLKIEVISPLSIKAGSSIVGPIDNPIVRLGGKPFIPGSSLKGVLRSIVEKIAGSMDLELPDKPCNILGEVDTERNRMDKMGKEYRPCVVCRIFGGPTYASHIYVYDMLPVNYNVEERVRVAISRVTGSVEKGPFKEEYVTPGSVFRGEIHIVNIDLTSDSIEAQLFNSAIQMLNKGLVSLGSNKSIGMGRIKVSIESVKKAYLSKGMVREEDITDEFLRCLGNG